MMLRPAHVIAVAATLLVSSVAGCSSSSGSESSATDGGRGTVSTGPRPSKPPSTTPTSPAPALVCEPNAANVSRFSPTWHAPNPLRAGACTAAQIDLLLGCTFGTLSAGCDGLDSTSMQTCADCAFTLTTSSSPGPLLVDGARIELNVPGCVAHLTGDMTSNGCGAKLSALDECARTACGPGCPLDTEQGFAAYDKCAQAAATGVCATYAQAMSTCVDTECSNEGDFVSSAKWLTKLFCAK